MPGSTKRKAPAKLAAPVSKGNVKTPTKANIDESLTSVSAGDAIGDTIEISSGGEDQSEYESEDDAKGQAQLNGIMESLKKKPQTNGKASKKTAAGDDGSDGEDAAPSFGELLRGNEAIDVPALLQQPISKDALVQSSKQVLVPPSHQSLTTVLTQALKTDDTEMLERCLHTTDTATIRNTIEHIDSSLAGVLLNRVAARLYRRPGRAGTLMVWVQWTLIAHGGALASQPGVVQGLNGLHKVMSERAKGLNSLLALRGKLDLLEAQMELRRRMKRESGPAGDGSEDEDEDEDVIWVEGEAEDGNSLTNTPASRRKRARDDEDDDDAPMTNGIGGDSDDSDADSVDDDDEDDSAGEEAVDENEIVFDEAEESGEDEESDAEPAPPSKLQKVASFFSKRK